jgi:predicted membrane protein
MNSKRTETLFTDADTFDRAAALSTLKLYVRSQQFRGGRLTAALSGVTLDLRDAELSQEGATINLQSALSGVDILVPRHWEVICAVDGLLSGIEAQRAGVGNGPILALTGSVVAGAVSVR